MLALQVAQDAIASPSAPWALLGVSGGMTSLAGLLLHRARRWRARAYEASGMIRDQMDEIDALGKELGLTVAERDSAKTSAEAARAYNSRLLDEAEKTEVDNAGLATRLTAEEHHKVALQGALDRRNRYRRKKAEDALEAAPSEGAVEL